MKKKLLATILSVMTLVSFAGCGSGSSETGNSEGGGESKSLIIYCPHPVEFIDPIVNEFESQTGIQTEVVTAGSGELLKRIESEGDNPLGDVMWGGSLSTLEPKADLFEEYKSANSFDDKVINDIPAHKSIELLQSGNYKVYEVSEMAGFSEYKHFSTVFKKYMMYSPSEFVKNCSNIF